MVGFEYRDIIETDLTVVLDLIHELACHEGRPEAVTISRQMLSNLLFADEPVAYGIVGLWEGQIVGYALLAKKFSSFKGHKIAYIEDVLISDKARGNGLGLKIMQSIISKSRSMNCKAIEWSALDCNNIALGFYDHIKAERETDRVHFSLDDQGMENLLRLK
jgi:GNAT superfamily N-acetyltransferase